MAGLEGGAAGGAIGWDIVQVVRLQMESAEEWVVVSRGDFLGCRSFPAY